MNVLYDITVLGSGHRTKTYQTGVFRAVDSIARRLVVSDQCKVVFCADRWRNSVAAYVASVPALATARVEYAHYNNSSMARYVRYSDVVDTETGWKRSLARAGRKLAYSSAMSAPEHERTAVYKADVLGRSDIFHATGFMMPTQIKQTKHLRKLHTFYDLVPVLFQEWTVTQGIVDDMARTLKELGPDDWAVAISQATKDDLCCHSQIRPENVFVTPLAADTEVFHAGNSPEQITQVLRKYQIPDAPYVLSLSTLEVRKNIDHVIRSFVRLIREQNIPDLNLVLAGAKGWKLEKITQEIESAADLEGRIILPGFVANEDLAPLYSGASVFVYPSLYEGFGLPPLEAMQCGTPVITSNTSSLPEVVGDAGIMLDPHDEDGMCQSLLDIYHNSDLRQSMTRRSLERATLFNWERCAQDTIHAYRVAMTG